MANEHSILNSPFGAVFEQFFDNASFLWELHCNALQQPHYLPADLIELKARIDSNLNGLTTTAKDLWPLCENALEIDGPGDTFVSTIIVFTGSDQTRIQTIVDHALTSTQNRAAFISALTWLPHKVSQPWLEKFMLSKSLAHKHLAIDLCSALRKDPKNYLNKLLAREDCLQDGALCSSILRLIGELKRHDLSGALSPLIHSDNTEIAFWASWSLLLLGDDNKEQTQAINNLKSTVLAPGSLQVVALEVLFRVLPAEDAQDLINNIAKTKQQRIVIKAVAILGDPHAIPWLLSLMEQPQWAKIAAEAFTTITGIDLEPNQLSIAFDSDNTGPSDDPSDDNVSMDEDENLPWPDTQKLTELWQKNGHRFLAGSHYFMGQLHSKALFVNCISSGSSRHRHAAAMRLALLAPSEPLINTHIYI